VGAELVEREVLAAVDGGAAGGELLRELGSGDLRERGGAG